MFVIALAALLTLGWLMGMLLLPNRKPGLAAPLLLSYAIGVLLLRPWEMASWREAPMFGLVLVTVALWTMAGCLIGAVPGMIIRAVAIRVGRRLRR